MIHKNNDGDIRLRTGDLNHFLSVVQYQKRIVDDHDKNIRNADNEKIDDLNERLASSLRERDHEIFPAYISTMFTALFLEAFIYDYSARKSTSMANMLDKLDPPSKWVIATKLFNDKGIETSNNCFSQLKKIFQLRNALAHNKSKAHEIGGSKPPSRIEVLEPDECLSIIKDILEELLKIDSDEIYAKILIKRISCPMY